MPVHNGGDYLFAAVKSILEQQHVELELILIDDRSTDSAISNTLNQLTNQQKQLIKIIPAKQAGLVSALNTGIKQAKNPFLARMDADDIAHPQRLASQLTYLEQHTDVDICAAKVDIFSEQHDLGKGYQLYQQWLNRLINHSDIEREIFIESPIPHPTVLMSQSIINELGLYQDNSWPEDYDLWLRALINGFKFGKPDSSPLLKWRDYPNRTSRRDSRYNKQQFLRCKAFYLRQHLSQQGINEIIIWGAGETGIKLHDLLEKYFHISGFYDVNPKLKHQFKRRKPVCIIENESTEIVKPDNQQFILVAVGTRGARDRIRSFLINKQLIEGQHFIFAA